MRRGSDFETELAAANEYYRKTGQAEIWPIHTGAIFCKKRRAVVYTKKVPGDYFGYLPSGRAVLVEAKSSESDVWTVTYAGRYTTVRVHQLVALKKAHECQVLAGMIVRLGKQDPRCFALSVKILWDLLGLWEFTGDKIWNLEFDFKRAPLKIKLEDMPEKTSVPMFKMRGWDYLNALRALDAMG